jgi:hypothetical protein
MTKLTEESYVLLFRQRNGSFIPVRVKEIDVGLVCQIRRDCNIDRKVFLRFLRGAACEEYGTLVLRLSWRHLYRRGRLAVFPSSLLQNSSNSKALASCFQKEAY